MTTTNGRETAKYSPYSEDAQKLANNVETLKKFDREYLNGAEFITEMALVHALSN